MATPVVVVSSGAPGFVETTTGGAPATPVAAGGMPITLISSGGPPITFLTDADVALDMRLTEDGAVRLTESNEVRAVE